MNQDVLTPDVVVIGAGPGGYPAAIRLAQLDKEVLVVERGEIGGVCLNWGCIPTKALYSTTEPLGKWRSWNERGVEFEEPAIDLQKIRDTQKEIVESLTGGVEKLLEGNGAEIIKGDATLRKGKSVAVKKADGTEITLEPKGVVLATGSRPFELPGFEFDRELVWNSRQALELEVI
ncbi:MAG: FAD-dependent oxidoreductase, partial [Candidatus Acetothermia bacterium]